MGSSTSGTTAGRPGGYRYALTSRFVDCPTAAGTWPPEPPGLAHPLSAALMGETTPALGGRVSQRVCGLLLVQKPGSDFLPLQIRAGRRNVSTLGAPGLGKLLANRLLTLRTLRSAPLPSRITSGVRGCLGDVGSANAHVLKPATTRPGRAHLGRVTPRSPSPDFTTNATPFVQSRPRS